MAVSADEVVSTVGKRLAQSRLSKDSLVKLLRQAAGALSELGQSSSLDHALKPLNDSLVQQNLLQHKDKDVRLLLAVCFTEIMRVLAPNPPYSDEILKGIFKLLISMFAELADTSSPYFTRRVKILETVSALKCCVLMLDIGCENLVLEMFNVFFTVVREDHQKDLYQGMITIMTHILDEKVTQPLLDVILRNLLKEAKGVTPSFNLAVSLIQSCTEKLVPYVRDFLVSSISDRDSVGSELKESYHDIIVEISQCAPQMLVSVIPNLTQELLTDQVDVRIKAVHLLGRLFALSQFRAVKEYHQLFLEFLKRFSDKSVEVRISAIGCARIIYMANPTGMEAVEVLCALQERLLDYDDKVRLEAIIVVCDLAKSNLQHIQPDIILQAAERLRDKKVSVRKKAMQKLLELYRTYCMKCVDGIISVNCHFEQIPSKILALCCDKDCNEFRPQSMDLVLAEDLFPATISVAGRIKHWISFFQYFSLPHMKVLNAILTQKKRLQMEMQVYLSLRKEAKEDRSEEVNQKMLTSFQKLSALFTVPCKAEESFQKLHLMKDNTIFKALQQLVDESTTFVASQAIRDTLLKRIGEKHPHYEFLRILSAKCSHNIFSAEHVECILLDSLSKKKSGNLETSVDLLLTIVSVFPSLLRGSEEHLLKYFSEEDDQINEKLLQLVAKSGSHLSIKLSNIYPYLERACLEGSRKQAKHSVSAIAALAGTSDQMAFACLYEKLMESLEACKNMPAVLQSLGCIAQYAPPIYEKREEEIIQFVTEKLFASKNVDITHEESYLHKDSVCSTSCKLMIFGLKTLVRSFLPHQATRVRHQITGLLTTLSRLLPEGVTSDSINLIEDDKAQIRLAATEAILKLARRWDLHISPQIFNLAIMRARDPSSFVRKSLIDKIHKLLKQRAIPSRYACAFALAASDCFTAVRADSMKYLADFIKEHGHEARRHQNFSEKDSRGTMTNYPEYVVVFLIHLLAHDVEFPSNICQDEDAYARFCSPLVVILHALVNPGFVESNKSDVSETVAYLLSIFRAIKKAKDAVDDSCTPKLHLLSDIGMLILKAFSQNGKSSSHNPGMVLLPSSLYQASSGRKTEVNFNFIVKDSVGRNFIERALHILESPTAKTSNPHTKRSKKSRNDTVQSEIMKKSKLNLISKNQSTLLMRKTKGEQENSFLVNGPNNTRQRSTSNRCKGVLEPAVSNSEDLLHEHPASYEPENQEFGEGGPCPGKDQFSSCGSLGTIQSSCDSLAPIKDVNLETNNTVSRNGPTTDSISISKSHLKITGHSKDLQDVSEKLVGHRVKMWSPLDKCFYSGIIDDFNSQNSTHKVTYDNGDVERLHLAHEKWEIISNSSMLEEDPNEFNTEDCIYLEDCEADKTVCTQAGKRKKHLDGELILFGASNKNKKDYNHRAPSKTARSESEVTDECITTVN
ncbi:sister chromatid cohesion protein PDS5 homolog B isoform X2 [Aristolochia californica]|uniref:sister chromatid cohesion protein PDS5 homolog B isoform X2 n=1 Tax=Aristolochia californica TaxID=171875 RepID=UPI0035DF6F73